MLEEGGTLDKYIGDALMAFWGAPVRPGGPRAPGLPDRAPLPRGAGAAPSRRWRAEGLPEIDIGVGINTGPMVVGNMGSDLRFDYTVMGDAVNLASRLEGANKLFQTSIMVSEETWHRVASQATGRRLGSVRLRGRSASRCGSASCAALRPPTGRGAGRPSRSSRRRWTRYAARKVQEAEAGFQAVLAAWPDDRVARRYLAETRTSAV